MLNLPGNPYPAGAVAPVVRRPVVPPPPSSGPTIDPSGIAPITQPGGGTAEDASPTTMVLQYLKSRGFQPTSENVRRALEANQRDPGVIPGLRSDRPATDAEDKAAMAAAGRGGGRGGSGGGGLVREEGTWDTTGSKNTSAPPPDAGNSSALADAAKIAGWVLGTGGLGGAGLYGAYKLADRFNPDTSAPRPGGSVPAPVDPGAAVPPEALPKVNPLTGRPYAIDEASVFPPGGAATQANPQVAPMAETQVTPFDTAMGRAVPGQVTDLNPVARPGSFDMTPPRGPVEPIAPVVPFNNARPPVPPTDMPTVTVRPRVHPGRLRLY